MASNVNNDSGQVERRVTRSGQVPSVRNPSENRRNRNSQVASVAVADEGGENEPPAPRSRASRTVPRSQNDTRDAFTRLIAPTLQIDRYKVELESAGQELMKEIKDLKFENDVDVEREVKNREIGIGNGDKILEASRKAVAWIDRQIKTYGKMTQKREEKMEKYKRLLSTLSVDVQIMLERLLVERQGQVIDLTRKNDELLTQIGMLTGKIADLTQSSSTTTIECDELKEFLQENLSALKVQNKENIETEAISNLRKQCEQLLYRNEEISKQKGRVDGELIQSREESDRFRIEKENLFRENEELKNDVSQHILDYQNLLKDKEQVDSSLVTKSVQITELESLLKIERQRLQAEILTSSISKARVEQLEREDAQRQEAFHKAEVGSIAMDYELNASKAQLKELNEKLVNENTIAKQVPGLKVQIEELHKSLEDSSEKQKMKAMVWDIEVEDLKKELKSVKADNRSLNADVLERDSKIDLLESKLSNLESIQVSNEALLKEYSDSIITKDLHIENMISRIKNSDDIDRLTLEYDGRIKKLSADLERAEKGYHNSRKIRDEDRGGHAIYRERAQLAKQKMMEEHIQAMAEKDFQLNECRRELKDKVLNLENMLSEQSQVISEQERHQTRLEIEIQRLNEHVEYCERELQSALESNSEFERQANEAQGAISEKTMSSAYQQGKIAQLEKQVKDLDLKLTESRESLRDTFHLQVSNVNLTETVRLLRRDADVAAQLHTDMCVAKDVEYEKLKGKKLLLEKELNLSKDEAYQSSLRIHFLETTSTYASTKIDRLEKEREQIRREKAKVEVEGNIHRSKMISMKTSQEYKELESRIHQMDVDALNLKFEIERLQERMRGMKTKEECDTLVKEKDCEKLELEKKVEKLREEIQGMKTKDEYDSLVKEKDTEKLELEKKMESIQEKVQGMKTKDEYDTLVKEKDTERLELEKKIEKLQEDLSKSITSGSLTINTGVFGDGNHHTIQQSPQHFGMGPPSPMGIQQSPSPRTPGFQPPSPGFSMHGSPQHGPSQHGPSGSLSQSPQQGFFGTAPQFPMHPPVYGQSLSPRPGFDAGSPMNPSVGMGFGVGPSPPPGINRPLGFGQSNPTTMQGHFGKFRTNPPPATVAPPSYKFLVSGGVEGGVTTMNVPPALNQKMMNQITAWLRSSKGANWFQVTLVSRTRCVEVRVKNISQARAPSSSDVGDKFACQHCTDRHLLCVLVGNDGPVIAPLSHEQRLPGATPQTPGYYIK